MLNEYRLYLTYSKRGANTVRQRMVYARQLFARFPKPLRVRQRDLAQWIYGRSDWSAETTNVAVTSMKVFYRWAVEERGLKASPAEGLWTLPIPTRSLPVADMRRVQTALLTATPKEAAIVLLGVENGLRRSEIAATHTDDRTGEWLTTTGKGGKTRITHISPELGVALDDLAPEGGGWYFRGRYGGHCSSSHIYDVVTRVLDQLPPHSMRRRAITNAYRGDPENGIPRDIVRAQRFAGHSKPGTTADYVLVELDDLRQVGQLTRVA